MNLEDSIIEDYHNSSEEPIPLISHKRYITRDMSPEEYIKVMKEDPSYRYMSRNMYRALDIYIQIKKMVSEDPRYMYMKPYIEKSMTCYTVCSLVITLSTLNPVYIMFALYKLS